MSWVSFDMKKTLTKLLSLVLILVMVLGVIPSTDTKAAAKSTKIRLVVDGIASTCKATKKNNDWYVNVKDVKKALGIAKPAGKKSGKVSLDKVAEKADISYECDMILDAAYFWTDIPYGDSDYIRAFDLGLVPEKYKKNRDKTITSTEFRNLLIDFITLVNKKKVSFFKKNVTSYKTDLNKGEAVSMVYYAAKALGADFTTANDFDSDLMMLNEKDYDEFWQDQFFKFKELFPNFYDGPVKLAGEIDQVWDNDRTAAFIWLFWHSSGFSGKQMVPYDYDDNSFHIRDNCTWEEAIAMITRLYDSLPATGKDQKVKLSDKKVVSPDERILSSSLLEKAKAEAETSPQIPRLSGLAIFYSGSDPRIPVNAMDFKTFSDWGFNSIRLNLRYEYIFDKNVQKVDTAQLKMIDEFVAAAIRYKLHLNISFETLPGRESYFTDEFTRVGSFDMYINEKHLKQAQDIWAVISERYSEVPSKYLSFTPLWETQNADMSTGIGAPDFTWEDARDAIITLMDTIRSKDPDRFIIFEPTSINPLDLMIDADHADLIYKTVTDRFDNVLMSSNFCEWPYVYQEMTLTEGKDIDAYTHSMYKQDYPTYIYAASKILGDNYPDMIIDGFLPQGTVLELNILQSEADSSISIKADDKELYSERFSEKEYELTSEYLSQIYPYAESEKKIAVTLKEKTDRILISSTGFLILCGINVILPEEYAVEALYYPSAYDHSVGIEEYGYPYMRSHSNVIIGPNAYDGKSGFHITIGKNVTYTSDSIYEKSDSSTINEFYKVYNKYFPDSVIRFENATFNLKTNFSSMTKYYADFFKACDRYGYGWFSNDYDLLRCNRYDIDIDGNYMGDGNYRYEVYDSRGTEVLGMEFTEYKGKYLVIPLLKFFQKYQSNER